MEEGWQLTYRFVEGEEPNIPKVIGAIQRMAGIIAINLYKNKKQQSTSLYLLFSTEEAAFHAGTTLAEMISMSSGSRKVEWEALQGGMGPQLDKKYLGR